MPRQFFRKFAIKRQRIRDSRLLAPFRKLLHEPRYWGIRRRTAVPAFALGLFVGWMPVLGHPFWGTLAALGCRVNIPVTVLSTLVSNPLTMYPMYYAAYRLGRGLLNSPPLLFDFEPSLEWLTEKFVIIWQPLMLGCLLLGISSALIGYVVLDLLWRASLREYQMQKRSRRDSEKSE